MSSRLTRAWLLLHSAFASGPTRFATASAAAAGTPASAQAAKTPVSSRCSAAASTASRRAPSHVQVIAGGTATA